MSIVVEDGTGVAAANSYVTVEELLTYAAARGITLPTEPAELEALLIRAMDYLETYSQFFMGLPTFDTQPLAFPRTATDFQGRYVLLGVPEAIRRAQLIAAVVAKDMELLPVPSPTVAHATRKTVGPITVEYEDKGGVTARTVDIPLVVAVLRPLMSSGFGQPRVVRG